MTFILVFRSICRQRWRRWHKSILLAEILNFQGAKPTLGVGSFSKLYITDMIRLHQDFDSEIEDYGIYQNEPNTIIVKEVSKHEIDKTINYLLKEGFFDKLGCSM